MENVEHQSMPVQSKTCDTDEMLKRLYSMIETKFDKASSEFDEQKNEIKEIKSNFNDKFDEVNTKMNEINTRWDNMKEQIIESIDHVFAVSYTHLDVYKRQV